MSRRPENPLPMPAYRFLVRPTDFVCGCDERFAVVLFKVKVAPFGPQHGWADLDRYSVRHREQSLVEGPVVPPTKAQTIPGIIRARG